MKKSLLISEIFPPKNGGSGRWFWELYSRLPNDRFVIAAGSSKQSDKFDQTHSLPVKRINLSSTEWGVKSSSGFKFYWRTFWQLRKLIKDNKVQAIHCGRCIPEGMMGLLLSKIMRIPYICYVHGEDVEAASTSRELSFIVKNVLKHAEFLICNSQNTAGLLSQWRVDESKIQILNPGVDSTKFVPTERNDKIKQQLGWGNRPTILTVGRLQKRKGQDMLIKALPNIKKSIPNILYAVIGGGDEQGLLEELVNSLNLQENVLFMSEIDDDTMLQCYQQCDLFILPNRTVNQDIEGFGMVLVEAQSCGKTVIAGDSGGTKETMIEGNTGFIIDCTNPEPIAKKLIELLKQPEKLDTYGKLGREHVVNTLDWKAHKEKAEKLFS
jgi:phosphatidylinositol alpha-1,6-mannosyltransferase